MNAVTYMNAGYYQETIYVKNSATGIYSDKAYEAIRNWNNSSISPRRIIVSTSASSRIYDDPFTNPQISDFSNSLGLYYKYSSTTYCSCHTALVFHIYINRSLVTEDNIGIATSVIAHELGHAFGLDDDNSLSTYLMSHRRDRTSVLFPTNAEVAGVLNYWNQYH